MYVATLSLMLYPRPDSAPQSKNYKMLSTSIFNHNGTVYDQAAVFGKNGILNETALEEYGLPAMTGSNAWANFAQNLAVSVDDSSTFAGLIRICAR